MPGPGRPRTPTPSRAPSSSVLVARGDQEELADRFAGTLEFGTAGLRGALGAGPNRMNRVVVHPRRGRPRGLPARRRRPPDGRRRDRLRRPPQLRRLRPRHRRGVDRRRVCGRCCCRGRCPPRCSPSRSAHSARAAGVMVTASHNPPQDNGYKVYLGDGSQIVPPADAEHRRADRRGRARSPTCPAADDGDRARRRRRSTPTSTACAGAGPADGPRDLPLVYTPLHGVGGDVGRAGARARRLRRAARGRASRREPDPDFPTVAFPNPEEPGAMDLAARAGRRAAAPTWSSPTTPTPTAAPSRCPTAATAGGCCAATRSARCSAAPPARAAAHAARYATSIVSSRLLRQLARRRRAPLRGDADRLQVDRPGRRAASSATRRRSATASTRSTCATRTASRAALLSPSWPRAQGARAARCSTGSTTSPREHGLHATDQVSVRVDDLALIADAMARLRAAPPAALGGLAVESVDDLAAAPTACRRPTGCATGWPTARGSSSGPSGTEPKLKCYLEVVVPVGRRRRRRRAPGSSGRPALARSAPTVRAAAGALTGRADRAAPRYPAIARAPPAARSPAGSRRVRRCAPSCVLDVRRARPRCRARSAVGWPGRTDAVSRRRSAVVRRRAAAGLAEHDAHGARPGTPALGDDRSCGPRAAAPSRERTVVRSDGRRDRPGRRTSVAASADRMYRRTRPRCSMPASGIAHGVSNDRAARPARRVAEHAGTPRTQHRAPASRQRRERRHGRSHPATASPSAGQAATTTRRPPR